MLKIIFYVLIAWNICVFALYGIDKWKSMHNRWRIKESMLLITAFLMGSVGALMGMSVFHHKTKHIKFKLLVPLALIVNIAVIIGGFYFADWNIPAF